MNVMVYTSDPDSVDPAFVAGTLETAGFFVASVSINDGERLWELGQPTKSL